MSLERTLPLREAMAHDLGLLGRSPMLGTLADVGVAVHLKCASPARAVTLSLGGRPRRFAQPITFTPFASVRPCTARCTFCSETLVHRDGTRLSASLRPDPDTYLDHLRAALAALAPLPMGLSLSGLEATDDVDWLDGVLDAVGAHERRARRFTERVLYSNGTGLARAATRDRLLERLVRARLSRVELSRHHPDPDRNQAIMRFRDDADARHLERFEAGLASALERVPVRLVCVLQRGGVADRAGLLAYLAWAARLGVRDVVVRELSRLDGRYRPNATARAVERDRVPLEDVLAEIWPDVGPERRFRVRRVTAGYYYWNLRCTFEERMDVTFETSDYGEMKDRHASGVVQKLVFHANGRLCGDWDPGREVLLEPAAEAALPALGGPLTRERQRSASLPVMDRALVASLLDRLERDHVRHVLIGSMAIELLAPGTLEEPPHDCDLLVPGDLATLDAWARAALGLGFAVTSWEEPVAPPLDPALLAGRFYLRARRAASPGAGAADPPGETAPGETVVDATYECRELSFEEAWAARRRAGGRTVAAADHVARLLEARGLPRDLARARRLRRHAAP